MKSVFIEWLQGIWEWVKRVAKESAESRPTSWVTHWLIAWLIALGGFLAGGVDLGMVVARIVLIVFAVREGMNWWDHFKFPDEHPLRYHTIDGLMDMAGPILSDVIFTYAALN